MLNAGCLRTAFREARASRRHFDKTPVQRVVIILIEAAKSAMRSMVKAFENRIALHAGDRKLKTAAKAAKLAALVLHVELRAVEPRHVYGDRGGAAELRARGLG